MRVLCQNLLYGYFSLRGAVNAQPDHAEHSSSQQTNSLEIFRKAVSEFIELIRGEVSLDIEP